MKTAILDTYYPEALKQLYASKPGIESESYDTQLRWLLDQAFGTADFVSRSLRDSFGWETFDVVANALAMQQAWVRGNACYRNDGSFMHDPSVAALEHLKWLKPDVAFVQDLSLFTPETVAMIRANLCGTVVAQCSCPWPGDERIASYDAVFTSFPHYVERIRACGGKPVFLKLAFDPRMADAYAQWESVGKERPIDVAFVGGFGGHWHRVMSDFEMLAQAFPSFKWWGYGLEHVPTGTALWKAHQGPAWGAEMYRIYGQAKVVVNRHGEIALSSGNNLRQYEATGMGAALVTDCVGTIGTEGENFEPGVDVVVYNNGTELVESVAELLGDTRVRRHLAECGHLRTLMDHAYCVRAETIHKTLVDLLAERILF